MQGMERPCIPATVCALDTLRERQARSDSRELALLADALLGAHERETGLARHTDHLPFRRRHRGDVAVLGRGEGPAVVRVRSLQCGLVERCGLVAGGG